MFAFKVDYWKNNLIYNLFFELNMKTNIAYALIIATAWSALLDSKRIKLPLRGELK